MILESVVCVVLHCSRCNVAFRDDIDDDYSGTAHWDNPEAIAEQFNNEHNECGGWRRFDDRYVCSNCQTSTGDSVGFADDPNAREIPEPLPPADADKVAREQARYQRRTDEVTASGQCSIVMAAEQLLELLDDVRDRVAAGDSWEGSLEYLIPEQQGEGKDFAVRAGYRTGNLQGQGGFRLIAGEPS